MAMSTALAAARNRGGGSNVAGAINEQMLGGNTSMSGIAKAIQAVSRKGQRNTNDSGGNWKSSVDERLVALEQGGDASSQSTPDIGAAPVPEEIGGTASTITGGGVANMATESNFSPDTKMAAEGMFGTDADRAASVQGKPNMMESPQISASAELGALFEKPETSYSAIGG